MSYKVQIFDEDGKQLYSDECLTVLISTVNTGIHVESRCYGSNVKPFLAGAIVAAEGLIETLFDDVPGLRALCDECREFCRSEEGSVAVEVER
ncbi:MAG: hypothetical protein IJY50_08115 [Clostridia bacterium]|nr:hypothetical protein [Clostridia bacterium]